MLAHGADIRVVQELLGHVSIATTQLYTKLSPDHLRTAYEPPTPAPARPAVRRACRPCRTADARDPGPRRSGNL